MSVRTLAALVVATSLGLCGCASTSTVAKPPWEQLFESGFDGLAVPETGEIHVRGTHRSFPHTTSGTVWDAAMVVLMQQGLIVRSSKPSGVFIIVTTPPLAVAIEPSEPVLVSVKSLEHLYGGDTATTVPPAGAGGTPRPNVEAFFDLLTTQVYVGEKWRYLSGGT